MKFFVGNNKNDALLVQLFVETFAASDGGDEGRTVGALAKDVLEKTADNDLFTVTASEDGNLIGCTLFTRLTYPNDTRTVFMLSPVAVKTDQQGKGVGQKLIRFGLDHLRSQGVDAATTYGDPSYYIKTGFNQVSIDQMPAPMPLSYPQGWLVKYLGDSFEPFIGPCICVDAFKNPSVW